MQDPSLALRMTFDSYKKESRSKERLSVNLLSYNKLLAQCTCDIHCDSATALRILVFLLHQPLGYTDTSGTIICGVWLY